MLCAGKVATDIFKKVPEMNWTKSQFGPELVSHILIVVWLQAAQHGCCV
jgi:hypothetical protein